jgi:flagellar basal-body rod protein FlgB
MPLIPNPTGRLIEHVMRFRDQRHDVIAANIANADTPGYRAFELVLDGALGSGEGGAAAMRRSDPRHVGSGAEGARGAPGRSVAAPGAPRLDGNNVSLDQEFLKLTENRVLYQAAFELYENFGGLTRLAREVR